MVSHSKGPFLLVATCTKPDSVSYRTILNIKRFYIGLKCSHFKTRKNGCNTNLIVVIVRDDRT